MPTKTTAHLSREHREAAHLLAAFRRYLKHVEVSAEVDFRAPVGLIDFLSESLFQRHEEKEEGVLLPELARMGLSWSDGALAQVRQEHRQARYLLRALRQAMLQGEPWSLEDRAHFLSIAHTWIDLLRDHMLREERSIFPFTDAGLDEETDAIMVREFEKIDAEYEDMPDAPRLRRAGKSFAQRFGATTQA